MFWCFQGVSKDTSGMKWVKKVSKTGFVTFSGDIERFYDIFRRYRKRPVAWNGLKTSAKQRFCDIFGEHRNGTLAWNRLSFKVSNLQNDQTHSICWLLPNSLSLFGDFVGLARKGLSIETYWSNSRKKKDKSAFCNRISVVFENCLSVCNLVKDGNNFIPWCMVLFTR